MKLFSSIIIVICLSGCGSSPAGPKGDVGVSGSNGVTVASRALCDGTHSGLGFYYEIIKYSDNSKLITCSIRDTTRQYSMTSYWKSSQVGATTSMCVLTYDIDIATSGYWVFSSDGNVFQTQYKDSGSSSNGNIITLTPDCSTN